MKSLSTFLIIIINLIICNNRYLIVYYKLTNQMAFLLPLYQ